MASTLLQTCSNCGGHGPGMGGGGMGGMGGWGLGGGLWFLGALLLGLLLLGLLVLLAVVLLSREDGGTGRDRTPDADRAMTLLRERYARGEIDDEEFEERSARLTGGSRSESAG